MADPKPDDPMFLLDGSFRPEFLRRLADGDQDALQQLVFRFHSIVTSMWTAALRGVLLQENEWAERIRQAGLPRQPEELAGFLGSSLHSFLNRELPERFEEYVEAGGDLVTEFLQYTCRRMARKARRERRWQREVGAGNRPGPGDQDDERRDESPIEAYSKPDDAPEERVMSDDLLAFVQDEIIVYTEHLSPTDRSILRLRIPHAAAYHDFDLALIDWGDGSTAPAQGQSLVVLGIDADGQLHVRIFDTDGSVARDTHEILLNPARAIAISKLKERIRNLKRQLAHLPATSSLAKEQKDDLIDSVSALISPATYPEITHATGVMPAHAQIVVATFWAHIRQRLPRLFDEDPDLDPPTSPVPR